LPMLGAFPLLVGSIRHRGRDHAPREPEFTTTRSTSTSVDSAGWTEVVIQEGRFVLSYVNVGRKAEVNASINQVPEAAPLPERRLGKSGGLPFDTSTCGCPSRYCMDDGKISCLSFNEVTK